MFCILYTINGRLDGSADIAKITFFVRSVTRWFIFLAPPHTDSTIRFHYAERKFQLAVMKYATHYIQMLNNVQRKCSTDNVHTVWLSMSPAFIVDMHIFLPIHPPFANKSDVLCAHMSQNTHTQNITKQLDCVCLRCVWLVSRQNRGFFFLSVWTLRVRRGVPYCGSLCTTLMPSRSIYRTYIIVSINKWLIINR